LDRAQSRHFYRYFEPADRFVRIRQADPGQAAEALSPALDAAGYRRAIVAFCVADWEEALTIDDPAQGEEELYRLVIDVNPDLDLGGVRLPELGTQERPRETHSSTEHPRRRLRRLARDVEARLQRSVVGQSHAIEAVAGAVRRASLGWNTRGPLASLLFVGPTGVGKTELARTLANELGEDALVRVDCSEFAEGHEYAKLVGAPPGYVGHADGGFLSAVEQKPNAVVLFDEIEKAHPRLHNLLLQILDEGHLTDGRGKRIDFRQSFVLMTSNLGTRELRAADESALGFVRQSPTQQTRSEIVEGALSDLFSPEFLGRLDEVIVFRNLSRADALHIARTQLTELAARVRRDGPKIRLTPAVARWIVDQAFQEASGARAISNWIRREIEGPLAEELLASGNECGRGGWLSIRIRDGRPRFERAA